MNSGIVKRTTFGAVITGAAVMAAGSVMALPAMASTACASGCSGTAAMSYGNGMGSATGFGATGTGAGTVTGTGTSTGMGQGMHHMRGFGLRPSSAQGFGQVAAAPVKVKAPINQLVGTVGAPLVNVNIPCPAPWWQGGLLGAKYNACSTATVNQQDSPAYGGRMGYGGHGVTGFGQVAAAPVDAQAPINQLVGTVGAPLVNVNIPCPAPWNQGGLLGAKYNACNTAPVNQQG